jgi:hypothetical protein
MTIYEKFAGITHKLIGAGSKFAQFQGHLQRSTPGNGPPHNPGPPVVATYPVTGTLRGVTAEHVDGTTVQITDEIATIPVPAVEPSLADKLVIGARTYNIVRVVRIPGAGTAVAFQLFVR